MKRLLSFLIIIGALIAPMMSFADTTREKAIRVSFFDGVVHTFTLSSTPVITFTDNGETVTFSTADGNSMSYHFSDIKNYTFINADSSVTNIYDTNSAGIKIDGTTVSIRGLNPNTPVRVFDVYGIERICVNADRDGFAEVSLDNFPVGVYIVNHGTASVKIVRK